MLKKSSEHDTIERRARCAFQASDLFGTRLQTGSRVVPEMRSAGTLSYLRG